ncbi:MAG: bifunctional homocysteine S-methyltransferase/methylenetetrahydrofolate reductase, partial [Candidatus Eisenbacteria bacterium]
RTAFGHAPADCYAALADAGADVIGANCSVGPQPTLDVLVAMGAARQARAAANVGVVLPRLAAMPNAGLPQLVGGRYLYMATPEYFGAYARRFAEAGVALIGGCCGTTPEHVAAMRTDLALAAAVAGAIALPPASGPAANLPETVEAPRSEATPPPATATGAPARGELDEPSILSLMRQRFFVSVELDPPRGINPEKILAGAALLAGHGVDAINVADSPMARVRMSAQALTYLVMRHYPQFETILHFTCRDRNLMGIQADLLGAHAMGLRTILALTGDPPSAGDYPNVTAVYDVDSVGLIRVIRKLNEGTDLAGNPIGERTNFAIACAVNPTADDLDLEVARFREKIDAGADFAMTQPFYDMAVWEEFLERFGPIEIPVLLGILPLQSFRHAEFMHNEVPGITVPEALRERMKEAGAGAQAEGVRHARALLSEARERFAGVYLMPSFGRYENVLEVLSGSAPAPASSRG